MVQIADFHSQFKMDLVDFNTEPTPCLLNQSKSAKNLKYKVEKKDNEVMHRTNIIFNILTLYFYA